MRKGKSLTGRRRIYRTRQTSEPDATRPKGDFLQSRKFEKIASQKPAVIFIKDVDSPHKMSQIQDYVVHALRQHQNLIKTEMHSITASSQNRFGPSETGIEKTVTQLHDYAAGVCRDSKRFGQFRFDLAVFAHKYVLQQYPVNSYSQLYVAQHSSDF